MALPIVLTAAQAKSMGIDTVHPSKVARSRSAPARRGSRQGAPSDSFHRFANELASLADDPLVRRYTPLLLKIHAQSPGQAVLSLAFLLEFREAVSLEFQPLQGRQIRLDIAMTALKVAIEVNGWSNHGKTLDAFKSDHLRTRDLMIDGWVIVPFTANEARSESVACVAFIKSFIATRGGMR